MFQKAKENKVIFFLIGIYLSAFIKEISMLISYRKQSDYLLFESVGKGYVFLVLLLLFLLIDGFAVWYMLRGYKIGLWLAIISTVLKRMEEFVVIRLSYEHLDLIKEIFIKRRQSRGLPVDEQTLNEIFTPTMFTMTWGLMVAFSLLVILLLLWKRNYFFRSEISVVSKYNHTHIKPMLHELERLGFYQYVDVNKIVKMKNEANETGYIYSDTGREFDADEEDLIEGGVGEFFLKVQHFLEKQGVRMVIDEEHFDGEKYEITVNQQSHTLYSIHQNVEQEFTTKRAFGIINSLLEEAGSNERIFALYGWNDQKAIFLTNEMYQTILHYEQNPNEKPINL